MRDRTMFELLYATGILCLGTHRAPSGSTQPGSGISQGGGQGQQGTPRPPR